MIKYKSISEIQLMREGGRRLKQVAQETINKLKPGVSTAEIDRYAEQLIIAAGGQPSFKKVPNYNWSTCLCLNEQIVHTPPSDRKIREGDILTIDIGMYYRGFHTDFAQTVSIGQVTHETNKFLATGRSTLKLAIALIKSGNRIGQISEAIQKSIEEKRYSIIRQLTGHGIGRDLHEDPQIPGFLDKPVSKTQLIKPGLVIAVEVIYAQGRGEMEHDTPGDWSIRTSDKSLSACFEQTVAITNTNTLILT